MLHDCWSGGKNKNSTTRPVNEYGGQRGPGRPRNNSNSRNSTTRPVNEDGGRHTTRPVNKDGGRRGPGRTENSIPIAMKERGEGNVVFQSKYVWTALTLYEGNTIEGGAARGGGIGNQYCDVLLYKE